MYADALGLYGDQEVMQGTDHKESTCRALGDSSEQPECQQVRTLSLERPPEPRWLYPRDRRCLESDQFHWGRVRLDNT